MVRRPLGHHHLGHGPHLAADDLEADDLEADDLESDEAERAVPVTAEADDEALGRAVRRARLVLWDFDGPICRLFARYRASRIADEMVRWLADRGMAGLLSPHEQGTGDPQAVLRAVDRRCPGSDLAAGLEEFCTSAELRAVPSAMPTAYADPLIRTWSAIGCRLAVVTNNSPRAVGAYLAGRGLSPCFSPHVYGRTRDLHRLKPDPYSLDRALSATKVPAPATLMVGDSPSDLAAATSVGVAFLGYARNDRKEKLLRDAGAQVIVGSLEPVLRVLDR
ncbi:HAD family hydrolase [Streptomyces sp. WG7]|uniref:HAD family hydrolase n=1 Tax=Streptomyces sp. WG7 TaxID=3417650 RepID=UPI003CF56BD5